MTERLHWERDGRDWPNREASRFVAAGGLRWHVQVLGSGPALLLVHGTGAATHSWREVAPRLAQQFTVVAPDLPGHGFSGAPARSGFSMQGMAQGLQALLAALSMQPVLAVGHSAGAAILARASLDGRLDLRGLVSLNGVLLPLHGMPYEFFSPMAKLLAGSSLVPRFFAWRAQDRSSIERLVRSTGSKLDARGIELYAKLVRSPGHVGGALEMMANWDLRPLQHDLHRLRTRLLLVAAENDRTVAPAEARRVARIVHGAQVVTLPGLGHLAHEEQPGLVVDEVLRFAASPSVAG
jgi:magnesium chelatase accessory protein